MSNAEAFKAILLRAIFVILAANVDAVVIDEVKLGKRIVCFFNSLCNPSQNLVVANISVVVRQVTSAVETIEAS